MKAETDDENKRARQMTFVLVGAGATGTDPRRQASPPHAGPRAVRLQSLSDMAPASRPEPPLACRHSEQCGAVRGRCDCPRIARGDYAPIDDWPPRSRQRRKHPQASSQT